MTKLAKRADKQIEVHSSERIEGLDAESFDEVANRFTVANTATKGVAHKTLVDLGIVTPTGRLTQKYK
ncbi:MAG: hypothetical protein K0U74_02555 [Alphaproteobacteria bacterium]|nr:hypothetical protein [Alphaproteobacteria bacterium]